MIDSNVSGDIRGASQLTTNMFSVLSLFLNASLPAKIFFGLCLTLIIIALIIYLYEISLSSKALVYHLEDLDTKMKK